MEVYQAFLVYDSSILKLNEKASVGQDVTSISYISCYLLWTHLFSFLWVLGEVVMVHDTSLILCGPVAHTHPSELLCALLGESGAWWGHACLL